MKYRLYSCYYKKNINYKQILINLKNKTVPLNTGTLNPVKYTYYNGKISSLRKARYVKYLWQSSMLKFRNECNIYEY